MARGLRKHGRERGRSGSATKTVSHSSFTRELRRSSSGPARSRRSRRCARHCGKLARLRTMGPMSIDLTRRATRDAATDLADMLLDRRCSGCGGSAPRDGEICPACDALVDRTGVALCLRCLHGDAIAPHVARGCPSHGSTRLLLAGPRFEPPLDRLIHAFKYEGVSALAPWVASLLPEPPELRGAMGREYVLVPISLHPARRAWRGYDQAPPLPL